MPRGGRRPGAGGRRPGAGAPRGNLNAFKDGHFSERFALLEEALLTVPEIREAFIAYGRHQERMRRKALQVVRDTLAQLAWSIPPAHDHDHPLGPLLNEARRGLALQDSQKINRQTDSKQED